jgi:EAL domain-containing protein (putative c-di-GMP-specific phosphodiesterase class I)
VLEAQGIDAGLRCHCGATRHEGALPPFSTMLASADMALERARAKGENEYEIEMLDEAAVDGSQVWRARIERALDDNQIALFTQDAFGFPQRMPVHSEVTSRILGADGEPVAAARFLPMAVRYGLIARLDCSVLEKLLALLATEAAPPQNTDRDAADQNTIDQNVGYRKIMALNVSARTLADPGAMQRLLALLEARRDLAGRLVFEMTEFGASQNVELAQQFGAEVSRLGAHFALDNFGAQKDSLMLVHALKPHYIKLSPRYSRELAGNADCRFFVASIVRIARTLDIGIFAQAVEDETLVPLLAELGLSGYQGLVGARPQRFA